jgi:Cu/Ag efflux protein CusF
MKRRSFLLLRISLAQRSLAGRWIRRLLSVPVGRRALCELLALLAVSCGKKEEPAGPVKEYRLTGVVVSYDADRKAAIIRHERIEGLMEGMTMEFPVRDEGGASKLVPGQRITARLFQRESDYEYWISGIQAVPAK